jgi:transcription initiation factor TFIID subunit 2
LLDIRSVTLSSPTEEDAFLATPASYSHVAPAQPLPQREPPIELSSHPEIKRKTWAAMGEQDEGELAILVSGGWVRLIQREQAVNFAPIHIQIDYTLSLGGDVTEGIVFRQEAQNEVRDKMTRRVAAADR